MTVPRTSVLARSCIAVAAFAALGSGLPAQRVVFRAWAEQELTTWNIMSGRIVVADLNADGSPDYVHSGASYAQGVGAAEINDGHGFFMQIPCYMPRSQLFPSAVTPFAVGDIDGDGDLDILVPQNYLGGAPGIPEKHPKLLYVNRGNAFTLETATRMPRNDFKKGVGARFADLDGDGDQDLVVWNDGMQDQLYLNDGKGYFTEVTATHLPRLTGRTTDIVAGDLDGDGDLDLVVAGRGRGQEILINDGKARFRAVTQIPRWSIRFALLGDVDRDGDLDLYFEGRAGWNFLYLNNGKAAFTDASNRLPKALTNALGGDFGDIDGDGDLDLVVNWKGLDGIAPAIWRNDGKGRFTEVTKSALLSGGLNRWATPQDAKLADFDHDGDLDLLVNYSLIGSQKAGRLYMNLSRHAHGPWEIKTGARYEVELWGGAGHHAWPLLNVSAVRWRVPGIGWWFVDPAGAVPLPPVRLDAKGRAGYGFRIPDNPFLAGRTFRVQHVETWTGKGGLQARAMNFFETRIR